MDLTPNEGSFYTTPIDEDAKLKASKERAKVLEILPFLQDIIDWFDKQADETDRMSNLNPESKIPLESQQMAYELLADLLSKKKGEFESVMSTYKKRK